MKPVDVTPPVALDDDLLGLIDAARADAPTAGEVKNLAARVAPLVGVAATSLSAGATTGAAAMAGTASAGTATAAKVAAGGGIVGATVKVAGMSMAAKLVVAAVAVTSVGVVTTGVVQHRAEVAAREERTHHALVSAQSTQSRHAPHAAPTAPETTTTPIASELSLAANENSAVNAPPTVAPIAPALRNAAHASRLAQRETSSHTHDAIAAAPVAAPTPPPSEVALLTEAQQLLATDPSASLAVVARHATIYAHGIHAQEREVLAIEALVRLGRSRDAEVRARTFFHDFPTSTHRRRIDVLLSGTASPKS